MKPKNKLEFRLILSIGSIFILAAAIMCVNMYISSRNIFLSSKNDLMIRDLTRTKNYFQELRCGEWYFRYWKEHPDLAAAPMTDEDFIILTSSDYMFHDETEDMKFLDSLSPKGQLAFAKKMYSTCSEWLEDELDTDNYDGLYFIDISGEYVGSVLFQVSKDRDRSKVGKLWNIDPDAHPPIRDILSGGSGDVGFEVVKDPFSGNSDYYTGYTPVICNGSIVGILAITYNWDDFSKKLTDNIILAVLLTAAGMLAIGAVIVLLVRSIAVKPVTLMQHTVRRYMENKDSSEAADNFDKIKKGSELALLADDLKSMTLETDKYIADIRDASEHERVLTKEVMEALAHTIDAKDKYTNGHSERVAIYSRMIAKQLGLSEKEQDDIYYMGLLHDIGKIGIPNDIINKTTKLTDEEYLLMKNHTVMGYEILSEIDCLPDLRSAARWHHECYDGSGYPDRLTGEDIPFLVRIIAVADSYDAMTSNRSYRKYLPQEVARAEIAKNIGTQFDPRVAECMLKIIDLDTDYSFHE